MDSDMSVDNLGGEAVKFFVQITGLTSKGYASEKGEPKTVREALCWFSDLQVI